MTSENNTQQRDELLHLLESSFRALAKAQADDLLSQQIAVPRR